MILLGNSSWKAFKVIPVKESRGAVTAGAKLDEKVASQTASHVAVI